MRLIDLFSGIGGFSLAATWVWGDSLDIACFCERDGFCQQVLRKHWPNVPIVEDVYDVEQIVAYARCQRPQGAKQQTKRAQKYNDGIDLIVGGWPCQPASCAGQRKGTQDDRWLWPPLLEAIRQVNPRYLLLENVPGLLSLEAGLVFEQCCLDLEAQGYEVQPLLIPACGVNAPHRRERLWIVANCESFNCPWTEPIRDNKWQSKTSPGNRDCHVADAGCQVLEERRRESRKRALSATGSGHGEHWNEHWYSVAARTCFRRVDDGVSGKLDRNRVNRLMALGNSIVPQVAAQIMSVIKEVDDFHLSP